MKRKILSLALVLMMVISMIPMGAFAAADASMYTSQLSVDKTSLTADYALNTGATSFYTGATSNYTASEAEFTAYVYNSNYQAASDRIIVVSSRDTEKFTTGTSITGNGVTGDALVYTTPDATGKVTVKVASAAAGTAKIGFFIETAAASGHPVDVATYRKILTGITDQSVNATSYKMIGSKDLTFTADSTSKLTPTVRKFNKKDDEILTATLPKANNINYYQMEVKVTAGPGTPVAGEKVEFTANSTNVSFDVDSVVTDGAGIAKVKVYATKAGAYEITAKTGSKTLDKNTTDGAATPSKVLFGDKMVLTFDPSGIADIKLATDSGVKIANETTKKIKLRLFDSNNNQYKINDTASFTKATSSSSSDQVKVEVVSEPSGSSLTKAADAQSNLSVSPGKFAFTMGDDYLKLAVSPKKEGDYTLKIYLDNGKKVEYKFTSVKQGTVTGINFAYTQTVVPYNSDVLEVDTLETKDANGITKDLSTSDAVFSSSDVSLATVATDGKVTVINEKDNVGKKVTITATDKVNKFSASYSFTIGGLLSTIKAEAPATSEVGKDSAVIVKYVDNKGNLVAFTTGGTVDVDAYVIEKPAGAIVGTEKTSTFGTDMRDSGKATYLISSNKEGTVKVQLVLTLQDNKKMSDIVTLNFGAATNAVSGKGIILTIGNKVGVANGVPSTMDLAPFIKDGRAFVPVRFISEALGAKVEYTKTAAGLTDTVTLTQGTTVVTMKINDTNIKVVKAGVESKVTSDVAAMIKDGRTVLPFRALADALGAKATYGMKADNSGVEWVKFEQ